MSPPSWPASCTAFCKPGHNTSRTYPFGTPGHRALNRDCPGQTGTFGQLDLEFEAHLPPFPLPVRAVSRNRAACFMMFVVEVEVICWCNNSIIKPHVGLRNRVQRWVWHAGWGVITCRFLDVGRKFITRRCSWRVITLSKLLTRNYSGTKPFILPWSIN